VETARERGATVKHSPEGGRPPGKYVLKYSEVTLIFVLIFDAWERLHGIELWRFVNEDEDVDVSLDGLDVFRTPKWKLRREIERRGDRPLQRRPGQCERPTGPARSQDRLRAVLRLHPRGREDRPLRSRCAYSVSV
jgi:hypothetical protein